MKKLQLLITLKLSIFIICGCLQISNSFHTSREAQIEYLTDEEFEKVGH